MLELNWQIIWTVLNLIVLYFLLKKYLFGPVTAMMEKRAQKIQQDLDDAKSKSNSANELELKYIGIHAKADGEAAQIIKEAKAKAGAEYDKIIQSAREDVVALLENANRSIAIEREKSMQIIKRDIAGIALIVAAKIAQKNIDEGSNKQLIDELIAEVGVSK